MMMMMMMVVQSLDLIVDYWHIISAFRDDIVIIYFPFLICGFISMLWMSEL